MVDKVEVKMGDGISFFISQKEVNKILKNYITERLKSSFSVVESDDRIERRRWTQTEFDTLLKEIESGNSFSKIAKLLNRKHNAVVNFYKRILNDKMSKNTKLLYQNWLEDNEGKDILSISKNVKKYL